MNTKIIILVCTLLFVAGCKKFDKFTKFDLDYNETVVIPSSTGISLPINILTPDIETNSESEFAVNDTRKDLIELIQLKTLDITLTAPAASDFSFLKSINIFLSADGLPEIEVAWKNPVPDPVGATIELETTDSDLKEYIKKDKFFLRVNTVTDEVLTSDHHIDVHSVFFVDAKILGQ